MIVSAAFSILTALLEWICFVTMLFSRYGSCIVTICTLIAHHGRIESCENEQIPLFNSDIAHI